MKHVKATAAPTDPNLYDANVLGAAVRAARTGAGMTLADAALSIGVAKQTLANLEAGAPGVSLGLVLKITQALGLGLVVIPRYQQARVAKLLQQGGESA
jgi:DNA-binding XRE family transcriptional regulator